MKIKIKKKNNNKSRWKKACWSFFFFFSDTNKFKSLAYLHYILIRHLLLFYIYNGKWWWVFITISYLVSMRLEWHPQCCICVFLFFFFLLTCAFHVGVSISESRALCTWPTTTLTIQIFIGMALFSEPRVLFIRPTNLFIQQLFH